MSDKEDFDHENRIYALDGKFKVFEEEFFKFKDELESKFNALSQRIPNIIKGMEMTPNHPIILKRDMANRLLYCLKNECTKLANEFINHLEELLNE